MEYARGKRLIFEFAEPVLIKLLQKFCPEIFKAEENRDDGIPASLSEKILPDHYYSFCHRRLFAKLRRMNYFVGEAERLYRQLLHDQLRYYNLYDFATFEEENPVVSEIPDETTKTKEDQEKKPETKDASADDKPLIEESKDQPKKTSTEEVKEDDKPRTLEALKKAAMDAEALAAKEIIAKFGVEYGQIKVDKVHEFVANCKNLQLFHAQPIV